MKFTKAQISDAKRYVRAEQYELARKYLRAARNTFVPNAKVLMLAGGEPAGEINCIRALFPKAHIVAADLDDACVSLALEAGANEGIVGNVLELRDVFNKISQRIGALPPSEITDRSPFDIVALDLCCQANEALQKAIPAYLNNAVAKDGSLIVTFSYGRDVREHAIYWARDKEISGQTTEWCQALVAQGAPETVAGRLAFLRAHYKTLQLISVLTYQGNQTPMCSSLWRWHHKDLSKCLPTTYAHVMDQDLESALLWIDSLDLSERFAVPADRLKTLRAKDAARRAVLTRQQKQLLEEMQKAEGGAE